MSDGAGDASAATGTHSAAGTAVVGSDEPSWVLVPAQLATRSQQMADGCRVQLYAGENFEGRAMMIVGPASIPEVRSPYGTGLTRWGSAIVGPNAAVTTFDGQNYRDRSATLRAGRRYADLGDDRLGLVENIESMRVTCAGGSSGTGQSGGSSGAGTANPPTER